AKSSPLLSSLSHCKIGAGRASLTKQAHPGTVGAATQGRETVAMRSFLWEFFLFGLKQARACLFAATFFTLLLLSRHVPLFGLARYDFLCLAAIAVQVVLLVTRIETLDELVVLCAFHAVGLVLELFKTHPAIGAWSYPEDGFFKLGTVPLYSGF